MSDAKSAWQTAELAATYLRGVRGALPGARMQIQVLGKIVESWIPQPRRILDLGCGDGILGLALRERFPAAELTLADFSPGMLEAAGQKTAGMPGVQLVQADFSGPAWLASLPAGQDWDVVVSGLAIHHQPDRRKRQLYAEIWDLLAPGGVFLNLEHVSSATPAGQVIFDSFFVDHLHRFHQANGDPRGREEVAAELYNRPDKSENRLASVERQCSWLRRLGFDDVDCFFKVFELAIFGGRKPSGQQGS